MTRTDLAQKKKIKLLRMAALGKDRPNSRTDALGKSLKKYITPSSTSFDKFFLEKLMIVAPGWFRRAADEKKQNLLKLASKGLERPSYDTPLGKVLRFYTSKSASSFDEEFTSRVKVLAPHWFRSVG